MKNRRLADLYVLGRDLTFDDGQGEPITVYLRKMSPVDQENAMRRANAARARQVSAYRKKESDDFADLLSQAMDMGGKEQLVEFLIAAKLVSYRNAREAELADDDEWSKEGYLQGLYDAWKGGLDRTYALTPEDEEAKRVFDEIKRFTDQVDEHVEEHRRHLSSVYEAYSTADLQENVADELAVMAGDTAWIREFRRTEIWLSTRLPEDHRKLYFESREEVDELPFQVYNRLVEELRQLNVEPMEGKGLPPTDASLQPSEPSEAAETSTPSIQLAAVQ